MDATTKSLVRERADNQCEYCRLPQEATPFYTFHVEHVIARQHRGRDDPTNLALACDRCNGFKGPNLTAFDPESGALVELFHPREQSWDDHFEIHEGQVIGLTPVGRATAELLRMNARRRVELRRRWLARDDEE